MRRLAKAVSAFTNGRGGSAAGRDACSFAARGASLGVDGIGAPSGRVPARLGIATLFAAILAFAVSSNASATKFYASSFGGTSATPALGGLFGSSNGGIGDIAVNNPNITTDGTSQSGWIYIVDRGNNRVQAFNPSKEFQWAIGRDVVQPGGAGDTNEKQTIAVGGGASGGSFAVTFGTTAPTSATINFGATATEVKEALETIGGIGAGNVAVSGSAGGPYTVEFVGARASVDQAQMTANPAGLTPSGTVTVATAQDGASFEKCTVASQCKVGVNTAPANAALGNGGTINIGAGLDIDQQTGDLFLGERSANNRVSQFSAAGAFIRVFGWEVVASGPGNTGNFETCNAAAGDVCKASVTAETPLVLHPAVPVPPPAGQFGAYANSINHSNALAVAPVGAPNAGKVYVGDPQNCRVQVFTVPTVSTATVTVGTPFGEIGTFAGPLVSERDNLLCGILSPNSPTQLATDQNGVVYIASESSEIKRYDTTASSFLARVKLNTDLDSETLDLGGNRQAMEIDPVSDHLLVKLAGNGIVELDLTDNPATVSAANVVDRHVPDLGESATGIGVGGSPQRYFISTSSTISGTGTGHRVLVIDDVGVVPRPTITLLPASDIAGNSATLNATVNPNGPTGFPTNYRFQVSKNGVDWTNVAADKLVGATGDGNVPAPISDPVGGLEGNTLYRLRVIASRAPAAAGFTISDELTFLTDRVKPAVTTFAPQARGVTTATLAGEIRPNGLDTQYYFQWGKTTQYERGRAPVPDGSVSGSKVVQTVIQDVDGLFPSSSFHYRLVATNAEGTTFGNDLVFETRATAADQDGRAYEMVTPPFKVVRAVVSSPNPPGFNPQIALPTLDGESVGWRSKYFPLTDDVRNPFDGDSRIISRTSDGWVNKTLMNLFLPPGRSTDLSEFNPGATSGNLKSMAWLQGQNGATELIPTGHLHPKGINRSFLYSEGTGSGGFSQLLADLDTQVFRVGLGDDGGLGPAPIFSGEMSGRNQFNDDGSVMGQAGAFRGLAQQQPDPLHPGRMVIDPSNPDPSLTQQLKGEAGGRTPYIVRADNAADLPSAPNELVSECTGTVSGGDATRIPMRNDNGTPGSTGDDYLDSQTCERVTGAPTATGTGDLTAGSTTISNVSTATGAFAVGQMISGRGISPATTITAAGAGTLTLSQAAATQVSATGNVSDGSNLITNVVYPNPNTFAPGQTISGAGIPAGATVASLTFDTITISANATASAAATALAGDAPGVGTAISAEPNHLVSARAASFGNPAAATATSIADDGNTIFFSAGSASSCATTTGPATNCPAQLFVRQYGDGGEELVRWISRARGFGSGAPAAGTGTLTAGSDTVTALTTSTGTFAVGQSIRGNGIPAGTTIAATGAGTLTLSQNATASGVLTNLAAGGQQIGQLAASIFQRASRDGRVVYFRSNAPLLPNDPNNGASTTTGSAPSSASADLYRYELPADRGDDPADGALTRLTAGPAQDAVGSGTIASGSPTVTGVTANSGTFVPGQLVSANGIPAGTTITAVGAGTLTLSANATASGLRALAGASDPNASDTTPVRFLSADGNRAYFTTAAPIAGADTTPPQGGITVPTGSAGQSETRNLYAFDASASGPERYKFVAALPRTGEMNECATAGARLGPNFNAAGNGANQFRVGKDLCFRGAPSGSAVVFFTAGKLTASDTTNTGDVYLYDIRTDELTRVSAPSSTVPQQASYNCSSPQSPSSKSHQCYADMGQGNQFSRAQGEAVSGWAGISYENISEDAAGVISVYFESPLQLVPEDTNSAKQNCGQYGVDCQYWDVYQWRQGELSLISPGDTDDNSWYSGNSLDGRDVFFVTSSRIDPREIDDKDFDVYDARIGGGFSYTPPPTPCDVLAHQCRGPASAQRAPDALVTSASVGASDNVAPPKSKKKAKRVKKKAKRVKKSRAKQRSKRAGRANRRAAR